MDDVVLSIFFFSSRRRHTRFSRDWSSDACSSDLVNGGGRGSRVGVGALHIQFYSRVFSGNQRQDFPWHNAHRSEERREGKSVDLGGCRIIKKKKKNEVGVHLQYNSRNG